MNLIRKQPSTNKFTKHQKSALENLKLMKSQSSAQLGGSASQKMLKPTIKRANERGEFVQMKNRTALGTYTDVVNSRIQRLEPQKIFSNSSNTGAMRGSKVKVNVYENMETAENGGGSKVSTRKSSVDLGAREEEKREELGDLLSSKKLFIKYDPTKAANFRQF